MSKLVIIDGNAILHRAFHAIPPLSTPNGEPVNAVYGLVSMLLNIIQNLKPTHLVVAFDEEAPTFRKKAFKAYQSQRPEMATELSTQFAKARKFLKAAKIPIYSKSGFEADDVIGTLATLAKKINEVVIVTGDRDILQLVDDKKNIKLFMPIGGVINGKLFGEAETIERMGVMPNQVADLKALTGDASDNYSGVKGIGPVTAEKLLKQYDTVNNIYAHIDDIEPKVREKLRLGTDDAKLFLTIATIVRDVPLEFDFPQMEEWNLDNKDVLDLFVNEFGFRTLTERIKKIGKQIEDEKQGSLF